MRIFNVMMSRDLGGIQQAYVDYHNALTMQKHEVINITSVSAQINQQLANNYSLLNLAPWCFLSKLYLWLLALIHKPDLIICHGNRAVSFASTSKQKNIPIIGVSHNYSYKHLYKCDYILVLTDKLKEHLMQHGIDKKRLLSISNMTNVVHAYKAVPAYKNPVIIGSFGRFVQKKGFIYLIEAIKLLNQTNHNVQLLLGGDGPDKDALIQKTKELQLEEYIKFHGWVRDKDVFFQEIDLFCLPSTIEPFGIILGPLPVPEPELEPLPLPEPLENTEIVFGSGLLSIPQMAKTGFFLNIIAIFTLTIMCYVLGMTIFDVQLGKLPEWVQNSSQ